MRKAWGAISVVIAALGGVGALAQARLWTVQAVDTGQGVVCDAFAAGAMGRAPYEFRFRRDARSLLLIVSYAGPKLKAPIASADIAIGSGTFRLPAKKIDFGGRNAFVVSIDQASFNPNIFDQNAPFVITAGGGTFGLSMLASDNVAANWRACLKASKIELNPPPPVAPGPPSLWDERVGTAALDYHLHFYFAGFLLRASTACGDEDFQRTTADAIDLIADPELKKLSQAYPDTTRQWMAEGADNFNKGVMTSGFQKACAFATTTIRSKAEKILNTRGPDGDVPDTLLQTPAMGAQRHALIEDKSRTLEEAGRKIDDACSGKNPDVLATLKALGIGCNGEKLKPDPTAKFANQAAEAFYELARQRPDFRVTHECQPGPSCQTLETATRSPNQDGETLRDTFFTYEDDSQKKTWCSQNTRDLFRLCFDAADGSDEANAKSWVEAYFPNRHHWARIELDNPACKDQQQSKYNVDNAYVACIVGKFDAP